MLCGYSRARTNSGFDSRSCYCFRYFLYSQVFRVSILLRVHIFACILELRYCSYSQYNTLSSGPSQYSLHIGLRTAHTQYNTLSSWAFSVLTTYWPPVLQYSQYSDYELFFFTSPSDNAQHDLHSTLITHNFLERRENLEETKGNPSVPTFGLSTPFAVLAPSLSLRSTFLTPKLHPSSIPTPSVWVCRPSPPLFLLYARASSSTSCP